MLEGDSNDNSRLWVPGTTEVFTEDGWMSVKLAWRTRPRLLVADLDKRKVLLQNSRDWQSRAHSGKIVRMIEGFTVMEYLWANIVDKLEVLDIEAPCSTPVFRQTHYTGLLYSFDTSAGTVILKASKRQTLADTYADDEISAIEEDLDDSKDAETQLEMLPDYGEPDCPDWWVTKTRW